MSRENEVAGVSMRGVRDSFEALEDSTPVQGRIVLYLHRPERGRPVLWFKAQACDNEGRPLSAVPGHGLPWPHPDFRTVAQLMHFLLEHVYEQVEYQLSLMPEAEPEPQ